MNSLDNFLKAYSVKGTKLISNHTRIGSKEPKIFGGAWLIPKEKMIDFNDKYFEKVFVKQEKEYLTETQSGLCLAVDLDFRYKNEINERQHTKDWSTELIGHYCDELKNHFVFDEDTEFNIYIMQKDNVNQLADGSYTKDGIHIIFGLKCSHIIQQKIRKNILKNKHTIDLFKDLPLINTLEEVFDEGISKGTTNWNKYGSRKPNHEPYKMNQIYNVKYDTIDGEWCFNYFYTGSIPLTLDENKKWFKMCSTQYEDNYTPSPLDVETDAETASNGSLFSACSSASNKSDYLYLKYATERGLFDNATKKYEDWFKMGCIIKNTLGDDGLQIWDSICKIKKDKYDKEGSKEFYEKLRDPSGKPATIKSAIKIMKDANIDLYNDVKKQVISELKQEKTFQIENDTYFINENKELEAKINTQIEVVLESGGSEVSLAKLIMYLYGDNFKCEEEKDKLFLHYYNSLWNETNGNGIRSLISTSLHDFFKDKILSKVNVLPAETTDEKAYRNKMIGIVEKVMSKLNKTSDKNNIFREVCEMSYDIEFRKGMNKAKLVLPLKHGKLINLETLQVRDRNINDKFNYECDVDYIPVLTKEQNDKWEKYFLDLFCGNEETKKCFVDVIKSAVSGNVLRYIFFLTGEGRNGKSVFFKVLDAIFNKAIDTISKSVIVEGKSKANINTEVEKLDKIRIGYVSELKDTDILNTEIIKQISGGDKINLRALFKTDMTITPSSNLFCLTNELPKIVKIEQATIDRLIIFPFNNRFDVNKKFEDEVVDARSEIFSYIMQNGTILDTIIPTDEMRVASSEYMNENDGFKEYFDCSIERVEYNNDPKNRLSFDELRYGFKVYCSSNDYKITLGSKTAFTRRMKSIFKINSQHSGIKMYYQGIKFKVFEQEKKD